MFSVIRDNVTYAREADFATALTRAVDLARNSAPEGMVVIPYVYYLGCPVTLTDDPSLDATVAYAVGLAERGPENVFVELLTRVPYVPPAFPYVAKTDDYDYVDDDDADPLTVVVCLEG